MKYRPKRLKDVLGQDAVVKSLRAALEGGSPPRVFLFTGPPGTGKTSLARIVMDEAGVPASGLTEVDAASNSGIDNVRGLTSGLRYQGFGESPNKGILIDECHRLSKQAWDALLKETEEPAPHVHYAFCTTEPDKVPGSIVTRCATYHLKPVRYDDLMDLLEDVSEREGFSVKERVLQMVAQAAEGSPRAALTMLAKVRACADEREVAELLEEPLENSEVIELCRAMVSGKLDWPRVCALLKNLQDTPPESIRIIIVNYLAKCLLGSRGDKDTTRLLDMMEPFLKPCNPSDKAAPLLAAFGRIIYP